MKSDRPPHKRTASNLALPSLCWGLLAAACAGEALPLEDPPGGGHAGNGSSTDGTSSDGSSMAVSSSGGSSTDQTQRELRTTEIIGEEFGYFGTAAAFVGDLDSDGYDEFVVMANGELASAYLFYGRPELPEQLHAGEANLILRGADRSVGSGARSSVAALGDVDGDGYPDFAFTASGCNAGGCTASNGVHLVYGGAERHSGEYPSDQFGVSWSVEPSEAIYRQVNAAGDVNGDGLADLLIHASLTDENPRGYLLLGAADRSQQMPAGADFEAEFSSLGGEYELFLGVGSPGDMDADGYPDLILATMSTQDPDLHRQTAWIFYGSADGFQGSLNPDDSDASFSWDIPDAGFSIEPGDLAAIKLGDLDADGHDDLAFVTTTNSGNQMQVIRGTQQRFDGARELGEADLSLTTPSGHITALGAGEIDEHAGLDILVGDLQDSTQGYHGGALMLLGSAETIQGTHQLTSAHVVLYGRRIQLSGTDEVGDWLGAAVASGGDADGDGRDDMLATAPGDLFGDPDGGRAFLILGAEID